MTPDKHPYNPLDKRNLAESVARALLEQDISPLPPEKSFSGPGLYAVYYVGDHPVYEELARKNRDGAFEIPIYVGKADPPGKRKGGFGLGESTKPVLFKRLREHAETIEQASNLRIQDFRCRYLVADDIWIPLGEALLIETFQPVWNKVIDGFGNHNPGKGRFEGQCPAWDVLHPGREWASRCKSNPHSESELIELIQAFFSRSFGSSGPR